MAGIVKVLEAISKGAPLIIKIDGSSSYAGKVFWSPAYQSVSSVAILHLFLFRHSGLDPESS
jgi:hypothetical protein